MTRILHWFFLCERWISCQVVTSLLCLHYRPETVHCSTKICVHFWNNFPCLTILGFSNYIFHKLLYTFFIPLQIVQYTFLIPFRFFSTLFIPFMTAVHSLFLSESTFYPFKELQNTFFPFRKWQYTYSFQKVL